MRAMLPPPAPISIMLTAGMATGNPLDLVKRRERATSRSSVSGSAAVANETGLCGRAAHVVSEDFRQTEQTRKALRHHRAGDRPDSISRTGNSAATLADPIPPFDSMICNGAP